MEGEDPVTYVVTEVERKKSMSLMVFNVEHLLNFSPFLSPVNFLQQRFTLAHPKLLKLRSTARFSL